MRDAGNGAQESSLGWELSHGALDPSPCGGVQAFRGLPPLSLILYVFSQSRLNMFWVILLDLDLCSKSNSGSIPYSTACNRATELEAGMRIYIYIVFQILELLYLLCIFI